MSATLNKGKIKFDKEENVWGYIKGKANWAKVVEPGEYEGNKNWEIDIYPNEEDMAEYIELAQGVANVAGEGATEFGKKSNVQDEFVKQDKDGKDYLKFKLEYLGYDGTVQQPDRYDKNGNKNNDSEVLVGNGSIVKVKYRLKPYYMPSTKVAGTSVRFFAFQVIDLVEYSSGGTDSGFGDESGQSGKADEHDGEDF